MENYVMKVIWKKEKPATSSGINTAILMILLIFAALHLEHEEKPSAQGKATDAVQRQKDIREGGL